MYRLYVGRTARSLAAKPAWWQRVDAGIVPFAARTSYDALAAAPHLSSPLHSRLWPRTLRTSVALHQQFVTSGPRDVTLKKGSKLRVKVLTGDVRNAGTPCGASVVLVGTDGKSKAIALGDSADTGFNTGELVDYDIKVPSAIGRLKGIRLVRADADNSNSCSGWFVERVEVEEAKKGGAKWEFQVHSWFGKLGDVQMSHSMGEPYNPLRPGPTDRELLLDAAEPEPVEAAPAQALAVYSFASVVPHPSKVKQGARSVMRREEGHGGEDSYMNVCHQGNFALGVADGVYMWRTQGIDAGEFSRGLMAHAAQAVRHGIRTAMDVLGRAAEGVQKAELKGSATVCIVTVDLHTGTLTAANVGDSGFMVLRSGTGKGTGAELLYRSEQQEHEFGRPFQLGHHEAADSHTSAEEWSTTVREGDIIVAGSDGLFDNVEEITIFEQAIDVMQNKAKGKDLATVAKLISTSITELAFNTSLNKSVVTPYSRGASEAFDMVYSGGKKDDICVVVGVVGSSRDDTAAPTLKRPQHRRADRDY